jgi:hypothetical protein
LLACFFFLRFLDLVFRTSLLLCCRFPASNEKSSLCGVERARGSRRSSSFAVAPGLKTNRLLGGFIGR